MKRYHDPKDVAAKHRNWRCQSLAAATPSTLGKYRKRHGLDCGNPRCTICHNHKVLDIKSLKQRRADLEFAEQMDAVL